MTASKSASRWTFHRHRLSEVKLCDKKDTRKKFARANVTTSALIYHFSLQSVSSEEGVPVFDLSRGSTRSTVSSDNGVYPLHASESDALVPDYDSLEEGESVADDPVFVEPQVRIAALHLFT